MGYTIIKVTQDNRFTGCDFVVQLSQDRKNTKVKIFHLFVQINEGNFFRRLQNFAKSFFLCIFWIKSI